ncbi:MAG: pilus assembly protein TadG-related protein [Acidobacteria bacterium]|nr:pilus assembly protein TadG-related protein [Acidobacteriota bacterium]
MLSKEKNRRQRGMTVATLAIFIVGLFGMAALAIDLGILYTARTSAQHAADAAALAGAWTFTDPSNPLQPGAAQEAAVATAGANLVLGKAVVISATDVNVDIPNRLVTVTVPLVGGNGIATYFARVFSLQGAGGMPTVDVVVQASAEASLTVSGSRCLKPIFIPNTILSPVKGPATCTDPEATREVIFTRPDDCQELEPPENITSELSPWYLEVPPKVGGMYTIKPGMPQQSLVPSQFYALDFGSGANDYECTLGKCVNECGVTDIPSCGKAYAVKTGNMKGPTDFGVDELSGPDPDIWRGIGRYEDGATGIIYNTSGQVVVAPVWDNCCQTINPGTNGQTARIVGFVDLFVTNPPTGEKGDVEAHLISTTPCAGLGGGGGGGPGGGTPPPVGAGPLGKPVRLVQTPVGP